MPNIFNTVGSLKFFNFISNSKPSGVPVSLLYSYSSNADFAKWLAYVALPGQYFWNSNDDSYFRFPYNDTETALATETLLSTSPATAANMRFRYHRFRIDNSASSDRGDARTVNSGSSRILTLSTGDVGSTSSFELNSTIPQVSINNNGDLSAVSNYFSFGVISPTTLVMTTVSSNLALGNTLDLNFTNSVTVVFGWMHNSIYTIPLQLETQRYYGCYAGCIYQASSTSPSYSSYDFRCAGDKNLRGHFSLPRKYIDVVLENGEYVPGLFVTDLVYIDDNFVKRGKADNRVLAMGRGNFKLGQIYQITNPFGRVGTEEWICISSLTPPSYTASSWTPGADTTLDRFKYWKTTEYDYLLMRVYTEAD